MTGHIPNDIINRRMSERVPVGKTATIQRFTADGPEGSTMLCTLMDISADGAKISTDVEFNVGDALILTAKAHPTAPVHKLLGKVVWGPHTIDHVRRTYGMQFYGVRADVLKELKADIQRVLLSQKSMTR